MYNFFESKSAATKHKVFISYYHSDDQAYRNEFERKFGHLFISKSVKPGDINTDLSTEYIKRLIQEGYISDSSVVLVLIGQKTYCRKHVDWEIYAGLDKKVNGYSGLLGILLPTYKLLPDNKYSYEDIPARLADNLRTKYASIYAWNWACEDEQRIKKAIESAFSARIDKNGLIDNSRLQLQNNLCG